MQVKRDGVIYFLKWTEARKVADEFVGCKCTFFGEVVNADPQIVAYELGYAVQYCKSGSYFPQPSIFKDGAKEITIKGVLHIKCEACGEYEASGFPYLEWKKKYQIDNHGVCAVCIDNHDREEPDSCGETISYWEQFDYDQ